MDMVICQCTALSFHARNNNTVPLALGLLEPCPAIHRVNSLCVTLSVPALGASFNAHWLLHPIRAGCQSLCALFHRLASLPHSHFPTGTNNDTS